MTGRESRERSAVPECSLILFSILCAQRLEAPEGSPARSLRAITHGRQRDRTADPRLHVTCGVGQEGIDSTAKDTPVSERVQWVDWWVGLRQ